MSHLWIHIFVVVGGVRIVEIPFDASPLDTHACCCSWCQPGQRCLDHSRGRMSRDSQDPSLLLYETTHKVHTQR